jgi:hypothetical protein
MSRVPLIICLVTGVPLIAATPRQSAPKPAIPPQVATLLTQAQDRLKGTRAIGTVVSLDVTGTETRGIDTRPKVDPYQFKLLLPDSFQLQTGPLIHTLARGVYGRRLLDPERYGGTFVEQMMADPESQKAAARGIQFHLMRLSLTYLARVPPAMTVTADDLGVKEFARVKGRTISFFNPVENMRIDLVLDSATAQPLATISHGRTMQARGGGAADTDWVSLFGNYREVAGIRFPHHIDEWIGASHSRVVVAKIAVNGLKPEDFTRTPPPAR